MPDERKKLKGYISFPILLLCIFALLIAASFLNLSALGYTENVYLSIIVLQLLIFMIPTIFYVKLRDENYLSGLRLKPFSASSALISLLFVFIILFGSILIKLFIYVFGYSSDNYALYSELIPSGNTGSMSAIYIILAAALVPAIVEEFIFRAVALSDYIKSGLGPISACVITSLLFSMLHFSPAQMPVYFFSGMALGLLTLICDSAITAMIVHFINNVLSLFFESYLQRLIKSGNAAALTFVAVVGLLLSLALTFFFLTRVYKKFGKEGKENPSYIRPDEPKANKNKKVLRAFISPTFILCIIVFIVYSVLKFTVL